MNGQLARAAGRAALYLWLGAIAGTVHAGSFQVTPIRVELSGAQRTGAFTIRNDTAEPLVLQIELAAWTQQDGQDIYAPTPDLLATPPIVTLAGNRQQVFRVGLRGAPDATRELAYRVFIQEVVPPPAPDFKGLQVALRVGVPAFVKPASGSARPSVAWSARLAPEGKVALYARNTGTGHLQVVEVALNVPGNDAIVAGNDRMSYVLADQSREWLLDVKSALPPGVTRLRLMAQTDAGPIEAELVLEPR